MEDAQILHIVLTQTEPRGWIAFEVFFKWPPLNSPLQANKSNHLWPWGGKCDEPASICTKLTRKNNDVAKNAFQRPVCQEQPASTTQREMGNTNTTDRKCWPFCAQNSVQQQVGSGDASHSWCVFLLAELVSRISLSILRNAHRRYHRDGDRCGKLSTCNR